MTEIKGEPVGWIVAARSESGKWTTETLGLWKTPEEAAEDKRDAEGASIYLGERWHVCAVIPVEDGQQ